MIKCFKSLVVLGVMVTTVLLTTGCGVKPHTLTYSPDQKGQEQHQSEFPRTYPDTSTDQNNQQDRNDKEELPNDRTQH